MGGGARARAEGMSPEAPAARAHLLHRGEVQQLAECVHVLCGNGALKDVAQGERTLRARGERDVLLQGGGRHAKAKKNWRFLTELS